MHWWILILESHRATHVIAMSSVTSSEQYWCHNIHLMSCHVLVIKQYWLWRLLNCDPTLAWITLILDQGWVAMLAHDSQLILTPHHRRAIALIFAWRHVRSASLSIRVYITPVPRLWKLCIIRRRVTRCQNRYCWPKLLSLWHAVLVDASLNDLIRQLLKHYALRDQHRLVFTMSGYVHNRVEHHHIL